MSKLTLEDLQRETAEVIIESAKEGSEPAVIAALIEMSNRYVEFTWMALGRILNKNNLRITNEFPIVVGNRITTKNG